MPHRPRTSILLPVFDAVETLATCLRSIQRQTDPDWDQVIAETPLERVDLIRSGKLVDSIPIDGLLEITLGREIENLVSGEYLYVRAVQEDNGTAWSSPIYVE